MEQSGSGSHAQHSVNVFHRAPIASSDEGRKPRVGEDRDLLNNASMLVRDLLEPRPAIYWLDLIGSAVVGYGALTAALLHSGTLWLAFLLVVSVLALYRALSFIHELSHIRNGVLPGFRAGWNLLIGIPMLTPSFLYEGVHNLHHSKARYGTAGDPEYLPLASMNSAALPLFITASVLAPIALLVRFALLAPISLLVPKLRPIVVERYSSLAINPAFRRRPPREGEKTGWLVSEVLTAGWALAVLVMVAEGAISMRSLAIVIGVGAAIALINQVRTLAAHLWTGDGEVMSVTAQYLDTVNVPPPALLPALWAPVGLRYHALHHLVPSLPYHALGEAHRRILVKSPQQGSYHMANYRGWLVPVRKIINHEKRQ